ncbi:hypothetical protein GCM10011399_37130 [Subtercola lobariae]|uniref:Uncharacterized protein n=1 Tax=Subtercola lobariae TaxID=1588641 RepID=A0A917BFV2_9MICO|nr:hypothetical protein GCM10011399_37130 [Subtercola lobariae]
MSRSVPSAAADKAMRRAAVGIGRAAGFHFAMAALELKTGMAVRPSGAVTVTSESSWVLSIVLP